MICPLPTDCSWRLAVNIFKSFLSQWRVGEANFRLWEWCRKQTLWICFLCMIFFFFFFFFYDFIGGLSFVSNFWISWVSCVIDTVFLIKFTFYFWNCFDRSIQVWIWTFNNSIDSKILIKSLLCVLGTVGIILWEMFQQILIIFFQFM